MSYTYTRHYRGHVQGVVLDWAGTTVDYGCFAPTMVFVEGFRERGVEITVAEARKPMGMYKRDHIAAVMAIPEVQKRWAATHSALPTDDDVQALFDAFEPRQLAVIGQYTALIPGVAEAVAALRERGVKIGSSTGYTQAMMALVTPATAEQGYAPDSLVTSDMVTKGRPAPWLIYRNMEQMGVYPVESIVKIGDTVADVEAGLNAGTWTVGIAMTGNELGLTQDEAQALAPDALRERLARFYAQLSRAGAHYVVDALADVPAVIDQINARLERGETPSA